MYPKDRDISNIVLVGFIGTGKTAVGMRLAEMLHMKFIDTDDIIEEDSSMIISDIFSKMGEEHFRDLESRAADKVRELRRYVIATGGGIVIRKQNIQSLKAGDDTGNSVIMRDELIGTGAYDGAYMPWTDNAIKPDLTQVKDSLHHWGA